MATVFKDMAYDDEDQAEMAYPCETAPNKKIQPQYPYGLCLSLDEKTMAKLGLDPTVAKIDGIVHFHALARITSVSSNQTADGKEHHRCELQIEQMAVESEDEENEEAEAAVPKRTRLRAAYSK